VAPVGVGMGMVRVNCCKFSPRSNHAAVAHIGTCARRPRSTSAVNVVAAWAIVSPGPSPPASGCRGPSPASTAATPIVSGWA
jgi:hypothetical protein